MSKPLRQPWAGPLGLYHPGKSVLHRCPPGAKLAGLALAGILVSVAHGPVSAVVALGVAVVAQLVSRVPWHRTTRGLLGTLVAVSLVGLYQWWIRGWAAGLEVVLDIVALVLLATIVTATTRADALLEVLARLARPLRHVGLSPETFALACGLFLRTIPVLVQTSLEARDAARARGLERDPRAVLVPSAVRMVAHARATGDALAARGLGED
ncbi:energy-coupling factor transporter transmembrane protein EcfT [Cellulomonas sp. PhB150]|uniref:energy-coupling factor transporter transmembrane component T family protein n=1 Tax=Cellulomonas sp. PhB150 TaxID=2485188 RepID=UPI000F4636A3|nr:energy-coupling factor transporter transmembrane protein EcfT [Cellulomonas sp. PhB150]ROS30395.1 biotin transport system permease protein [Cellulomonas sp. PhB150]